MVYFKYLADFELDTSKVKYMWYIFSPEICENKPYNNKSDIWALGTHYRFYIKWLPEPET